MQTTNTPTRSGKSIRANLVGADRCHALGIAARSSSPVLALCQALVAAGHDPDIALQAYRGGTLALVVRSIGEGARLTVKSAGNGAPVFAIDRSLGGAGASPVSLPAKNDPMTINGGLL